MKRPPLPVIVIAGLLIGTGAFGLFGDYLNFKPPAANRNETLLIAAVHLLAIVAGAFTLRGNNWARWLAVAWMAFHVAISFGHPLQQLIVHAVLLVLFAYGLFRADARPFFQSRSNAA
jgi:NADH:ubiquinone oxidoreductase subunit 4 (subunit M)